MKTAGKLVVPLLLLVICLPWGNLSVAQEQKDEAGAEEPKKSTEEEEKKAKEQGLTEKIKVTATRVETDLMKTPVAVTVFDQDTLDREGVQNVRDLAQMVPNMDIATKNGQSTPMISMRGIRSTNETELGDPSVGVHLDGIYSPRMQGALAMMFDNERVEVLRGPQGTLFGRNSTVGSINIITAKPKFDLFEKRISLQYGNYNAPEIQVIVNKPLSDTFAVRFAGRYFRTRFVPHRLLGPEPVRSALHSRQGSRRRNHRTRIVRGLYQPRVLHKDPEVQLVGRRPRLPYPCAGTGKRRRFLHERPGVGLPRQRAVGTEGQRRLVELQLSALPQRQRRWRRSGQLRKTPRASSVPSGR